MRERWFERLLGLTARINRQSAHMGYVRRLSPLDATYTKERATDVCLGDAVGARLRPRRATRTSGSTSTTGRRSLRAPA